MPHNNPQIARRASQMRAAAARGETVVERGNARRLRKLKALLDLSPSVCALLDKDERGVLLVVDTADVLDDEDFTSGAQLSERSRG